MRTRRAIQEAYGEGIANLAMESRRILRESAIRTEIGRESFVIAMAEAIERRKALRLMEWEG